MVNLDLSNPDAPDLLYAFSSYASATNLVHSLGLQASGWLADRGHDGDGRRIYGAALQPLSTPQKAALRLAAGELRSFEASHGRRPGDGDEGWLEQAWQRAASALPGPAGETAEGPGLRPLFDAVLRDERVRAPAADGRAEPARQRAQAAAKPADQESGPPSVLPAESGQMGGGLEGLSATLSRRFFYGAKTDQRYEAVFMSATLRTDSKGSEQVIVTWQFAIYGRRDNGERIVDDIKEQEVVLCGAELLANSMRLALFAEALRQSLNQVFAGASAALDQAMPYDFIPADVLALKKATTVDDMRKAMLVKSRLGRYLA